MSNIEKFDYAVVLQQAEKTSERIRKFIRSQQAASWAFDSAIREARLATTPEAKETAIKGILQSMMKLHDAVSQ